jgi:hypothetical protein
MNLTMFPPAFLAAFLATLLAVVLKGISQNQQSGAVDWLVPALVIMAIISLCAFCLYLLAAVNFFAVGS